MDPADSMDLADLRAIDDATEDLRRQSERLADDRAIIVRGMFERACQRRAKATGIQHGAKRDVAALLGVSTQAVTRSLDRADGLAAKDPHPSSPTP